MAAMQRRTFMKAAAGLPLAAAALAQPTTGAAPPDIIDTNVHVMSWPFRRLKYGSTSALTAKLRRHRVKQAWAGSFEAVLHKDVAGVNARLAETCRAEGEGMLIPFGTVNPAWPDWEEDLRLCQEAHGMPGVRLYPGYHGYTLKDAAFARLLGAALDRGLLVQIVLEMEDPRVHHPALAALSVDASALPQLLKNLPAARVQLLNAASALRGNVFKKLVEETAVSFEISHIEGNGAVGELLAGQTAAKTAAPLERLSFGSHAPFFPVESAVIKCFESPLTAAQLQAILHDNAARLLTAGRA